MKKIGYAVLGLGIGLAHADAVLTCPDAELVALCDIDEKRLEKASKQYPRQSCTIILTSLSRTKMLT